MGLSNHIQQIHTTKLGEERIRRNLKLGKIDVVSYCQKILLDSNNQMYRKGKNWYCELGNIQLTIHASSYTIITAHLLS